MVVLAAFAEGQSVFRDLEDLRNDQPMESNYWKNVSAFLVHVWVKCLME
jgi:hypothetical protein